MSIVIWLGFIALIVVFLVLDLGVFLDEARRLELTHVVVTTRPGMEPPVRRFQDWREQRPALFESVGRFGAIEVFRLVGMDDPPSPAPPLP